MYIFSATQMSRSSSKMFTVALLRITVLCIYFKNPLKRTRDNFAGPGKGGKLAFDHHFVFYHLAEEIEFFP